MDNNFKLIGLTARKQNGKDTVADYLIKNYDFQRYSFADPLKRAAMDIFGFTEKQMWGSNKDKESIDPRWGISPRRVLQLLGTELLQYDIHDHTDEGELPIGREIWVKRFKLWYEEEKNKIISENSFGIESTFNIVIADIRFEHEANAIREMGGEIWGIIRPSMVSKDNHVSEMELDNIIVDKTIINDGDINELYKKIDNNIKY